MGGNGWHQIGPYQQDMGAAFRTAQDEELARDDRGFTGKTMAALWRDPEWQEFILTGGTGTVLDQIELVDATDTTDGPFMRPLTDEEVRAWCPTGRPTEAEWRDAMGTEPFEFPDRAAGNCTVLYEDGRPARIGYWGVTAD